MDDNPGWTRIQAFSLRDGGYAVQVANSARQALDVAARALFDLVVIDINLGSRETGDEVARILREGGFMQPIILVSGDENQLSRPIVEFSSVLALGPTHFWDKNDEETELVDVVRQASRGVDPIRRSLLLMKAAGLGGRQFRIDDAVFTVDDLLDPSQPVEGVLAGLREALMALLVESGFSEEKAS